MARKASDIQVSPYPSILLIGDSGTHKTWFAGSCPKPYIFDFDGGMAILRGNDVAEYDTFKDAPHGSKTINPEKGIYSYGKAWPAFIKRLNEIGGQMDEGTCPYETLVLDSLTTLSNIAMNYVMASDNHTGNPQIQHWGSQMQLMEKVLDQFSSWPIIKVVTAHIQRNTNDITQVIEMLPLLTGKLAGKAALYFDDVYFTNPPKTDKSGKKIFTLTTESSAMMKQAKSRYGVPTGTETEWAAIKPFILGQ